MMMKYIKFFESFNRTKLEEDINGILVELVDKGFRVNVTTQPFFDDIPNNVQIFIASDNENNFIYNEISDYIDTVIDYMSYAWVDAIKSKLVSINYDSHKYIEVSGYQRKVGSYRQIPSDDSSVFCDFSITFKNRML
jgi:hypothetical protein